MSAETEGVLLRIELGQNPPTPEELRARIDELVERLRPKAIVAGTRYLEDAVEVAIVSYERYRAAQLGGPAAMKRLTPWGEDEEDGAAEACAAS